MAGVRLPDFPRSDERCRSLGGVDLLVETRCRAIYQTLGSVLTPRALSPRETISERGMHLRCSYADLVVDADGNRKLWTQSVSNLNRSGKPFTIADIVVLKPGNPHKGNTHGSRAV
jgi:hypothetical protein